MKKNITDFKNAKKSGEKITWITAYDYPMSQAAEKAGIDMILVGDSGTMVQLGYKTTNPATMDEMILLAQSVRRGAPNTFIVGDMPQGSYEVSNEDAIINALKFVKLAGCDAVKLEGGARMSDRIKAINNAGILVIGHLGLTPQSAASFGGYRVQCKNKKNFEDTMLDSIALEKAGACILLLEALPEDSAEQIAKKLEIPVYGIGAGIKVDGQLIIMHDLTGFYSDFRPWFAKCYVPEVVEEFVKELSNFKTEESLKEFGRKNKTDGVARIVELSISKYIKDVKEVKFPSMLYTYPIKPEELADLKTSLLWKKSV